jgi:hypothetical protein
MGGVRKVKSAPVETETEEETETETPEVEAKPVDVGKLKKLMGKYEAADGVLTEARTAVDEAMAARSEVVKKVAEAIAPKTKFRYQGRELLISHRGDSWFFRGPKKDEPGLVEVD